MGRTKGFFAAALAAALLVGLVPSASAGEPTARLIDIHEIKIADHARGGGKGPPGGGGGKGPPDGGGGTANCSDEPASFSSPSLIPTGWRVQGNKTARLNESTVPSDLGSVLTTMNASFSAWDRPGVPSITVQNGGTTTREKANHTYDVLFGRTSGSAIAVTYTWRWSTGEIESDVVFNSRLAWFQASSLSGGCVENAGARYDLGNIATHEFGHVYGIDHPSGGRWESMYSFGFTGETLKRSPTGVELDGIDALY